MIDDAAGDVGPQRLCIDDTPGYVTRSRLASEDVAPASAPLARPRPVATLPPRHGVMCYALGVRR